MSSPYLGEIRTMSFNYAPEGWAMCNGQILAINQYTALFALLGTMYGGNGTTNFALPNLQGRVPIGPGGPLNLVQGASAGEETHTLLPAEMPQHAHNVQTLSALATTGAPGGNLLATTGTDDPCYVSGAGNTALSTATVSSTSGGLSHSNLQPYLVTTFCIALAGIFPTQN
jgi:microcystin-dependent protein